MTVARAVFGRGSVSTVGGRKGIGGFGGRIIVQVMCLLCHSEGRKVGKGCEDVGIERMTL